MQQGQPPPASAGRPQAQAQARSPGSFSSLPGAFSPSVNASRKPSTGPRPPPLRTSSSGSDDGILQDPAATLAQARRRPESPATPIYNQFATAHANASGAGVQHQNFSRLGAPALSPPLLRNQSRKQSSTQGLFDSTLPSTTTSNLAQVSMNTTAGAAAMAAVAAAASASPP
ncbi:hypothetical protein E4U42_002202, partial [Claviceps africana]